MPARGPYGRAAPDEWKLPLPALPKLRSTTLAPVAGKPLTFRLQGLTFAPIWESHHQRFSAYWDLE